MERIAFLGQVITQKEIKVDPSKVDVITNQKKPENITEVRSFWGLADYYRRFVQDFSKIAGPLTKLTQIGQLFIWDKIGKEVFRS